jgi:hypothetical protein
MFPTKFWFIWPSGFGGEDFLKLANQKQELPVVAMFVNRLGSIYMYGRLCIKFSQSKMKGE